MPAGRGVLLSSSELLSLESLNRGTLCPREVEAAAGLSESATPDLPFRRDVESAADDSLRWDTSAWAAGEFISTSRGRLSAAGRSEVWHGASELCEPRKD